MEPFWSRVPQYSFTPYVFNSAGIIMFFPDGEVQLVGTVLAAFAAVCVVIGFQPYRVRSNNLSGGAFLIQVTIRALTMLPLLLKLLLLLLLLAVAAACCCCLLLLLLLLLLAAAAAACCCCCLLLLLLRLLLLLLLRLLLPLAPSVLLLPGATGSRL